MSGTGVPGPYPLAVLSFEYCIVQNSTSYETKAQPRSSPESIFYIFTSSTCNLMFILVSYNIRHEGDMYWLFRIPGIRVLDHVPDWYKTHVILHEAAP